MFCTPYFCSLPPSHRTCRHNHSGRCTCRLALLLCLRPPDPLPQALAVVAQEGTSTTLWTGRRWEMVERRDMWDVPWLLQSSSSEPSSQSFPSALDCPSHLPECRTLPAPVSSPDELSVPAPEASVPLLLVRPVPTIVRAVAAK